MNVTTMATLTSNWEESGNNTVGFGMPDRSVGDSGGRLTGQPAAPFPRRALIRYHLARREGRSVVKSLVLALFIRTPPELERTGEENRARLMELKKRWDEGL
jgi:hypothetical protein